jgi:hypothetical protein
MGFKIKKGYITAAERENEMVRKPQLRKKRGKA